MNIVFINFSPQYLTEDSFIMKKLILLILTFTTISLSQAHIFLKTIALENGLVDEYAPKWGPFSLDENELKDLYKKSQGVVIKNPEFINKLCYQPSSQEETARSVDILLDKPELPICGELDSKVLYDINDDFLKALFASIHVCDLLAGSYDIPVGQLIPDYVSPESFVISGVAAEGHHLDGEDGYQLSDGLVFSCVATSVED